jgi:hypothetical protein
MGMIERYALTTQEIERLHNVLLRRDQIADMDGETDGTLEMLELMLATATEMTITYEGPVESLEELVVEEELCGNCAKVLTEDRYSDYACSELCEEAILERAHEEEVASGEYIGPEVG